MQIPASMLLGVGRYGVDGPIHGVNDDGFYYATPDMLEEMNMTDKNTPVCAPMTTLTTFDPSAPGLGSMKLDQITACADEVGGKVFTEEQTLVNVGGDHEVGSENELAARRRKLLLAESVLDEQREAILDVFRENETEATASLITSCRDIIELQTSRPSPDYRSLLLNAHAQLEQIRDAVSVVVLQVPVQSNAIMGAIKEALRLTDVERLGPWPGSEPALATEKAINEAERAIEKAIEALGVARAQTRAR